MQPFLLLGSFQSLANFIGVIGLIIGGLMVYGWLRIFQAKSSDILDKGMSFLLLFPGLFVLLITAVLFFGDW